MIISKKSTQLSGFFILKMFLIFSFRLFCLGKSTIFVVTRKLGSFELTFDKRFDKL